MPTVNNPQQTHWFYLYVLPLLPTVLTIIGWWIVHQREQNKRQTDRFHNRIDAAIELSNEVKSLAIVYYSKPENEIPEQDQEIVFTLKKLADLCNKIAHNHDKLQKAFNDFKIEVTGGDFQSKKRGVLPTYHQKFFLIRDKAFRLRTILDDMHDQ